MEKSLFFFVKRLFFVKSDSKIEFSIVKMMENKKLEKFGILCYFHQRGTNISNAFKIGLCLLVPPFKCVSVFEKIDLVVEALNFLNYVLLIP